MMDVKVCPYCGKAPTYKPSHSTPRMYILSCNDHLAVGTELRGGIEAVIELWNLMVDEDQKEISKLFSYAYLKWVTTQLQKRYEDLLCLSK